MSTKHGMSSLVTVGCIEAILKHCGNATGNCNRAAVVILLSKQCCRDDYTEAVK